MWKTEESIDTMITSSSFDIRTTPVQVIENYINTDFFVIKSTKRYKMVKGTYAHEPLVMSH